MEPDKNEETKQEEKVEKKGAVHPGKIGMLNNYM